MPLISKEPAMDMRDYLEFSGQSLTVDQSYIYFFNVVIGVTPEIKYEDVKTLNQQFGTLVFIDKKNINLLKQTSPLYKIKNSKIIRDPEYFEYLKNKFYIFPSSGCFVPLDIPA